MIQIYPNLSKFIQIDPNWSKFFSRYCLRNSPGPSSISNAHEWNMFAKCIMQLLGYQTDTINFATEEFSTQSASRDNSVASPKSSKKMRHSDDVSNMSKVGIFNLSSKELKKVPDHLGPGLEHLGRFLGSTWDREL